MSPIERRWPVSISMVVLMPTRSGGSPAWHSTEVRIGMRCTTLTQLPVAFCGGSTANSAPVTITVGTYPDMACTGKVTSLAQSTGAEFAVLPPQNATGNWVKVVQRIPIRTSVVCKEGDPPLRVGMSTTIEIDTGHSRSIGDIFKSIGF